MRAQKHKKYILKLIEKLREAVCQAMKEGHIKYPPKRLPEFETDVAFMLKELERTDFVERKT